MRAKIWRSYDTDNENVNKNQLADDNDNDRATTPLDIPQTRHDKQVR